MATSVTAPTCEGFVRKSHGSRPFSSRHVTRYLVADGFRVSYYTDESRTSLKGHFDLRNVVRLRSIEFEITIADGCGRGRG